MRLNDQELKKLLREGESFRVEFKQTLRGGDSSAAIREAICAFANDLPASGQPGILFVGVDDTGQPTGLEITDDTLRQLADIKSDGQIVPPPSMLIERRQMMGRDVAVVTVMPSDSPPMRYRGRIYVRIGPRRGTATAQDERILNEKRLTLEIPFDVQPVPTANISALNQYQFENEYLLKAFDLEILQANDRSLSERLAATKMVVSANETIPTVVGLLVLGRNPRDYIPNAWVQFLRIDGTELSDDIIDGEEVSGDLTMMIRQIDERMKAHIHTRIDLTTSDTELRLPSYPLVALQQIVRNAIMHRTYEGTNTPVRITWFNDRIEIQNPGGPFGSVTQENFGQPGVTDYRNPNLSEAMKVLGFVQRFGVGIASARRALSDNGHPDLKFEVNDNFIAAIIEGKQQ